MLVSMYERLTETDEFGVAKALWMASTLTLPLSATCANDALPTLTVSLSLYEVPLLRRQLNLLIMEKQQVRLQRQHR